jgi:endonuclease V-like protein UPF0215 family
VRNFRVIKPEIRVLGVDDGGFVPHVKGLVPVVGVVFRGGYWLDGVMSTMVVDSPHFRQVRVIMLNGVTFAGFNVVDVQALNGLTGLPVVAVTREKPDLGRIKQALEKLPLGEKRWSLILKAGEVHEVSVGRGKKSVYLHATDISLQDAERIVRLTSTRSNVPEALRVAHMVASGISHV